MKIQIQHDERDCGAACLSMIASFYGIKIPISKCRELTKTDRQGANIYGIVDASKKIGLDAEALWGTEIELNEELSKGNISLPFIARVLNTDNSFHYIIVKKEMPNYFIVYDPALGKMKIPKSAFFSAWTGHIIKFSHEDRSNSNKYILYNHLKIHELLENLWLQMGAILVISFIVAIIGVLGAFIFQISLDNYSVVGGYEEIHEAAHVHKEEHHSIISKTLSVIYNSFNGDLNKVFISLLFLYLLQGIIKYIRGRLLVDAAKKIDIKLVMKYYCHIIDMPISSIVLRQTGEYMSRFSDSVIIRQAISGITVSLFLDSLMVVFGGIMLFLENKYMFLISLGMIIIYSILVIIFKKPVDNANRNEMETNARLNSFIKESIDGIDVIKANNAGERAKNVTRQKVTNYLNASVKNNMISILQESISSTIELVGSLFIIWQGVFFVKSGFMTVGSLVTFYALLSFFTNPIKNLLELQPIIQAAYVAADRLNDILVYELEDDITKSSDDGVTVYNKSFPYIISKWEALNISFRYGNHNLLLKDISLSVKCGERIAIVGESGSGKTTLAKLFMGFYQPESGTILADGNDISQYSLSQLREKVAYVGQNEYMFSGSIFSNLTLGNTNITEAQVEEACKKSGAAPFITESELGYQHHIDENGANLSAGQKQRLAIARALLRNPQLLILDEATSNMDTITENGIKDTIFQLDANIAVIVIAHRLNTIKLCDKIYVMKDGSFVESGTFDQLMSIQGEFYKLWVAM